MKIECIIRNVNTSNGNIKLGQIDDVPDEEAKELASSGKVIIIKTSKPRSKRATKNPKS